MSRQRMPASVYQPTLWLVFVAVLVALAFGVGASSTAEAFGAGVGASSSGPADQSEMLSVPDTSRAVVGRGDRQFDGGDRVLWLVALTVMALVIAVAGGLAGRPDRTRVVGVGLLRIAQDRAPPGVHRN